MKRRSSQNLALPLAAALLAFPLGARAQQAPAPPSAPGVPAPPGGVAAPTGPSLPGGTGVPRMPGGGGGGGGFPMPPGGPTPTALPPPPPPPPPIPPGLPPPMLPSPGFQPTAPSFPEMPMPAATVPGPNPAPPADTTPPAPEGVTLRYKFTPGQTVRYHITTDLNGSLKIGASGTDMPMKQHQEMTLTQTVQSVSHGVATLRVQISGLTISLNGQTVPMPAQAQKQIQQPFILVMNTRGQVQSVKMPGGTPGLPGMGGMGISPAQLAQMQALPVQAVSTASAPWRADFVSPATGIESHAKYTLTDLSPHGSMATIAQKLWLQFKPAIPSPATATPSMPVKLNGLMTGTGTQQFDVTAGQVESQINHLHLVLTVTPPGSPNPVKTDFQITMTTQRQGTASVMSAPPASQPVPPAAPPAMGTEPPTNQLQ